MVDDAAITAFFSADPEAIAWPYPLYESWRTSGNGSGVVRWESGPATLVTRYDDVKAMMGGSYPILQNAYRFGELAEGTIARLPIEQHEVFFKVLDFESLFLSRHEGEEHARLRRIASRAFTARRIEQLRESIQQHVDDLIEEMLDKPNPDMRKDPSALRRHRNRIQRRAHRWRWTRPRRVRQSDSRSLRRRFRGSADYHRNRLQQRIRSRPRLDPRLSGVLRNCRITDSRVVEQVAPATQGPPAHLPEPAYPCCLPALGGLSEVTPHGGSSPRVRGMHDHAPVTGNLPRGGFA